MDFRDFMTNPRDAFGKLFRKKSTGLNAPTDATRQDVDGFVQLLLDDEKAAAAEKLLRRIAKATPQMVAESVAAAALDAKFHEPHFKRNDVGSPVEQLLALLKRIDRKLAVETAVTLADAASDHARKTAASWLGAVGSIKLVPVLARLLNDDDGYVRSYVWYGVRDAIEKNAAFAAAMYPLYLEQCDCDYEGAGNDSPSNLFELDPDRAKVDLASERFLSPRNPVVHTVLETLEQRGVSLPEATIRPVLEHGLSGMNQEHTYPNQYIVAAALKALARSVGKAAIPDLMAAIDSPDDRVQEAAAEGLAALAGVENPSGFALERCETVGFERLTEPQRVVYCCFLFDAEVCNGGIAQFLGNSSGDYAVETMAALKAIGHPEAINAMETAMRLIGPPAKERDRDRRVRPFADRYDELQAAFDPLESAFYKTKGRFRQAMLRYATDHAEHFRRT